jgi:hypothetical protein
MFSKNLEVPPSGRTRIVQTDTDELLGKRNRINPLGVKTLRFTLLAEKRVPGLGHVLASVGKSNGFCKGCCRPVFVVSSIMLA